VSTRRCWSSWRWRRIRWNFRMKPEHGSAATPERFWIYSIRRATAELVCHAVSSRRRTAKAKRLRGSMGSIIVRLDASALCRSHRLSWSEQALTHNGESV
jgi:hypothetical protein